MADNQATAAKGAVAKSKVRSYRQYMNRKGACVLGGLVWGCMHVLLWSWALWCVRSY